MSKTAEKSDPKLWEQVKDEVTAGDKGGDPGQWSARKAQMAVQEYKKRGGGYTDETDKEETSLRQWTEDDNAPGKRGGDGDGGDGDGGTNDGEATKAELYDEAKSRDLSGRSKMDKGELRSAIDDDKADG